jgi:hypothetical protein
VIVFLTTRAHQNTVRQLLRSYGAALAGRVVLRSYERTLGARRLPRATYVFADLERLAPADAERAAALWERLRGLGCRLLNHPTRSLRRYELLRTLHERGINRFDVYRVAEGRQPARYPVFLRGENDHGGARTPLLHTPAALRAALAELDRAGTSPEDTLIVELCDTADAAGLYRKYAAFRVGDRIIPRHLFFRDAWMAKGPNRFEPELLAEERAYLETNPHAAALAAIFAAARIDYGRIDYALSDGAPQVWEINTNPLTASYVYSGPPLRAAIQAWFAERVRAALEAIDGPEE